MCNNFLWRLNHNGIVSHRAAGTPGYSTMAAVPAARFTQEKNGRSPWFHDAPAPDVAERPVRPEQSGAWPLGIGGHTAYGFRRIS